MLHTVRSAASVRPICIILHRIYMYITYIHAALDVCLPVCFSDSALAYVIYPPHARQPLPCLLGIFLQLALLHCGEFAEDQVAPRGIGKLGRQVHPGEMTFFGRCCSPERKNPTRRVRQGGVKLPWVEARSRFHRGEGWEGQHIRRQEMQCLVGVSAWTFDG